MNRKIYRSRKRIAGEEPVPLPPEVEYAALCALRRMLKHYGAWNKVRLVEERMEEILSGISLKYDELFPP